MFQFLHKNRIIVSIVFSFFVIFGYGFFSYENQKYNIIKSIDEKLISTAIAAQVIIGDDFIDRAQALTSISATEDMNNIIALSKFAKASGVKYIYLMILDQKKNLRFISSSGTDDEIETGKKLTRYYDIYEPNQHIFRALTTKHVVYEDFTEDAWGEFRSIYIPYTTYKGKVYVIGVDVDLSLIRSLSFNAALKEVTGALLILLSLSPILYLLKMFKKDNSILQTKIDEATKELQEINSLLQEKVCDKTNELLEQFYHDSLTNLPNRNQLKEDLQTQLINAIAIVNIDDFKEINDFFGIKAGDEILIQFANFINEYHLTYRLSGDEFALIYDKSFSLEDIVKHLELLILKIEDESFSINEQTISIRPSIGLAYGNHANLISADIALHQSKEKKIPLSLFEENEQIKTNFENNIIMANTIKYAVATGNVICHYQPIASFETNEITKYESLVRLKTKDHKIVYPNTFLKLSQKTKHYPEITRSVVKQSCEAFANRSESFSINLSISDITNPSTVNFILHSIQETKTAKRVVFEILESEGIENFDIVSHFIEQVKSMGAKIAIDDFGTGYSSFENILKLNIDYIKIDGSLIKNIDTEEKHAIVVETIIDFAKKIHVKTVAEYVCNEAVYTKCKQLGIDYAQGFHIGKPDNL
ncbi:MAG: bifunctional diguanylate cyclase/phosphodiesterase [Sulfuricurvum sp.]|uniref:bifunctional diguanylate cyclase/phosphodiesterase n=1 Tax=Sulfuricurvum sp. TaxID=2025608 RepID=UPI00261E1A3E|nr:bifunctional diguanylate cyclase/phosphodiesterase [Sulfuricurvum sp.]MDD2828774.1 bifunctional diguanylate cyclase/phosphodiesterase [Sulfuricurvum sp.]MDD4948767.1 bifunctional diguanylate cyclase/phosphodiesterase [Sulfuricurvum sp.]